MRFTTCSEAGRLLLCARTADGTIDLARAHRALRKGPAPTPATLFHLGLAALPELGALVAEAASVAEAYLDERQLVPGPSVPSPGKIVCVGLNYRRHAAESKMDVPESPIIFSKFGNAIAAHRQAIPMPNGSAQVDYEAELAVVIGRRASEVSEVEALDYVLGYASANDLSARDLQFRTSQWLLGKTLDGFLPIGPDLVTADEVPDPQALEIRSWVNDELRQDSTTTDMIFDVRQLISYVSRYVPLDPGDLILTGTPEGVIAGMDDPVWLAEGDRVAVEVGNLGRLENVFGPRPTAAALRVEAITSTLEHSDSSGVSPGSPRR